MPTRAFIVLLLFLIGGLAASGPAPLAPADAEASSQERAADVRAAKRCKPAVRTRSRRAARACRRARAKVRRARRERRRQREQRVREHLRDNRPFSSSSFWNTPLRDDAPLDAKSPQYVARLNHLLTSWLPYVNTTRYSAPIYTVPADQPTVRVILDNTQRELQEAFNAVPIPPGARPAAGTDSQMVVWQPSTDTMWEFWVAHRRADGWHARYGGKMENVSKNPGHFTEPNPRWGATATSLPLLGGLMRLDELEAGRIDHALAMALPELRANAWSWPAQRSDGSSHDLHAIPEGARFRIDPALDLSTLEMSPIVRTIARAVQRHGAVVRDGGGAVAFYAEDPTPTGRDPFSGPNGLFGGRYISSLLQYEFPWEHMQVLKTQMTYRLPVGGL